MASLSLADVSKRQNSSIIMNRIVKHLPFTLVTGGVLITSGRIKINGIETDLTKVKPADVSAVSLSAAKKIEIEGKIGTSSSMQWVTLSKIEKDPELAGRSPGSKQVSKSDAERQERGLVSSINEYVLKVPNLKIHGIDGIILGAEKQEGLSSLGQEPYIDVVIKTTKGDIGISCKDVTAPSLAGGGLKGLISIDRQLIDRLHETTKHAYAAAGLVNGAEYDSKQVPDLYIEIPSKNIFKILAGTKAMGGPVDMMYIGPMDVTSSLSGSTLKFNGNFFKVIDYSKKYTFYFRLRKRDIVGGRVTIDLDKLNSSGYPNILSQRVGGKANARWVIQNSVPNNNKAIKLI